MQTLEIMRALSPPDLPINSCGCLGRCGAGPNVALVPEGIIIGHCGTAAAAARIIARHYEHEDDDATIRKSLDALALRKRAQVEFDMGNFPQADLLLSQVVFNFIFFKVGKYACSYWLITPCFLMMQAIHLKPFGGLHIIYTYRFFI